MALVDEHLLDILRRRGSDLHLMAGEPPRVRLHGELLPLTDVSLSAQQVQQMLLEITPRRAQERFDAQDNADFAYSIGGRARFRVNILRHLNGLGAVFRAIAGRGVTLAELEMPEAVHNLARLQRGLILVTGKTGSGKSTTLSAIVDDINTRTHGHIITIEDPIEFVHQRKGCLISQREVGLHAPSFAAALRSALREDPDVVLVGELRDLETMSIAVTAAEMGILVLATLHTNGAAQTIDRMINTFPADKQPHVRTMLSTSLRGVISQQLLQRTDAVGRIAAMEIMLNTPAVSNLIRQDKLEQLESTLQSGAHLGMRTMDSAIATLLEEGRISGREAYAKAQNKARFEATKESG